MRRDCLSGSGVELTRVTQTDIPPPARMAGFIRHSFCANYFREPRKDALLESLTITDGVTFLDGFEERAKFVLRQSLHAPAPSRDQSHMIPYTSYLEERIGANS